MNWALLFPLLVTTLLGVFSWFAAHWLSSTRDRENKKRDLRLSFLLEAYRRLEAGANRGSLEGTDFAAGFESAIADIQLLGTVEQAQLAKNVAISIARRDPQASAGPLLRSLRDELREHLSLQPLAEEPLHFRLTVGNKSSA
ncbi:MAG: hypothetical protein WC710_00005 [Gallionella sp.]|jgi:hypothetical protein